MTAPLVSPDRLRQAGKILFITHLAVGDFAYLKNCFQLFSEAYPHLEVHLWVDELRRTANPSSWKHLRNEVLYDWLAECPFIHKTYCGTYSPSGYEESVREAQQQDYPLVVSLATLRPPKYARLGRLISQRGFLAGMKRPVGILTPHHAFAYRLLDASIVPNPKWRDRPMHISEVHADWFRQLFGTRMRPEARYPYVEIPQKWREHERQVLDQWGFRQRKGKLVFINPYAKTKKRCWPLERVAELISEMSLREKWRESCFIVNALPAEVPKAKQVLEHYGLQRTQLFSADQNFFQLPAILTECDLIISVETSVMHLANAVHVPVIALMRQKTPEWAPIDADHSTVIRTPQRRDWVEKITVDQVMGVL